MGKGGLEAADLCSVPGILKIVESVFIFITLIIHRHGDNGHYLFFATTGLKLSNTDPNIDAENLGNSTLVTFMVINIVLIIGYLFDGRELVQRSWLEPLWNMIGTCMFFGTGIVTILTWKDEEMISVSGALSETEFTRNVDAAMAMAGLAIFTGILYFVDVIVSCTYRKRDKMERYNNP